MRLLLTNDDGIDAPGLAWLHHALGDVADLVVVAPARVQSATSHAVTFHRPILTWRAPLAPLNGGPCGEGVAVDGRPADCVKLALSGMDLGRFDAVVSGINAGANIGINVLYSGTVAAAREAAIQGVPALAVSLHVGDRDLTRWPLVAQAARPVLQRVLADLPQPGRMLNINVPILDHREAPRGWRVAPLSLSPLTDQYHAEDDLLGRRGYRARSAMAFRYTAPDSDVAWLFEGFGTITPLRFDMTDAAELARWDGLNC